MTTSTERSLVLVKPDGVRRGLTGEIVRRIEAKGVRGVAIEERGDTTHRIEIRGAAEALAQRVSDWSGALIGATRLDCQP